MGLLRALFWLTLIAAFAFAVLVYLKHGTAGFAEGATGEIDSLLASLRSLTGGTK